MVAFDVARKRANDRMYMPRGDGYERSKEAFEEMARCVCRYKRVYC